MDPVTDHLQTLLLRDLDAFQAEIAALPDDTALWQRLPGMANAPGNLALHIAGNLQYFVGAILGGSDYLRHREQEFAQDTGTRAEVTQELARARRAVETVLPGLDGEALGRDFPVPIDGIHLSTQVFLLRLSVHLAYHLGQVNVLCRTFTAPRA